MGQEDFSKYNGEGTALRKAQLRMLDILVEVDKICKKHNIAYWIDYGTLLGAVRHGGFIPWDDDLDISILKEDYERLLPFLEKELPAQLHLQNCKNEKYFPLTFSKVVEEKSVVYVDDYSSQKRKYQGVWIDVFPVIKGNKSIRNFLEPFYGRCFRRTHGFEKFGMNVIIAWLLYPWALLSKWIAYILFKFSSKDSLVCDFGMTASVFKTNRKRYDIFPTKTISFEGVEVQCPNNPDAVLKAQYGNYMQIPPEDKRVVHALEIEFLDE